MILMAAGGLRLLLPINDGVVVKGAGLGWAAEALRIGSLGSLPGPGGGPDLLEGRRGAWPLSPHLLLLGSFIVTLKPRERSSFCCLWLVVRSVKVGWVPIF